MSYELLITETAKQDLRDISLYIVEISKSIVTAKEFIASLCDSMNILKDYPNVGSFPKDRILLSNGYRYIVYKDYLIFYIINDSNKTINILSIFNSKKDYVRVMKKFI